MAATLKEERSVSNNGSAISANGIKVEDASGENSVTSFYNATKKKKELAGNFRKKDKIQQAVFITLCVLQIVTSLVMILKHFRLEFGIASFLALLAGITTADFIFGILHWLADSYGSVDSEFYGFLGDFGRNFIRKGREHHIDPTAVTRYDFLANNGAGPNVVLTTIILLPQICILSTSTAAQIAASYTSHCYFWSLALFLCATNQIHVWSHTYNTPLPRLVLFLQRYHLILPRKHHTRHHTPPYDTYFCLTTGWLNWPLHTFGFWTGVEAVIEYLTGIKPRTDDLSWAKKPVQE